MIIIPLHQPISLCARTAVHFLSVWVCCPCLLWVWHIALKLKLFLNWNEWYRKVLIKKTLTHKINLLLRTKSSKNFHLHTTGMNCKRHRSCIILDCTVCSTRLKTSYFSMNCLKRLAWTNFLMGGTASFLIIFGSFCIQKKLTILRYIC